MKRYIVWRERAPHEFDEDDKVHRVCTTQAEATDAMNALYAATQRKAWIEERETEELAS